MIATDLIGAIVECADGLRGRIRLVVAGKDETFMFIQDSDGRLRVRDVLEDDVRIVESPTAPPAVEVTASTLTREHIDVVRRAEVLSSSEISIAEVDLADEDRSTTAIAKVVTAYNRLAGGGGK